MSAESLAHEIDAAVAAVPGVTRVYRAAAGAGRAVRLLLRQGDAALSEVTPTRVVVSIGVDGGFPAERTAAAVAAVVRPLVDDGVEVLVRVGRIEG